MEDGNVVRDAVRAIEVAREAWERAHHDLPPNPMARTAAIPACGVLAAAILDDPRLDAERAPALVERAVAIARRAWELTHRDPPGNPIAATAEKAVIGIVAAGVLRRLGALETADAGRNEPKETGAHHVKSARRGVGPGSGKGA